MFSKCRKYLLFSYSFFCPSRFEQFHMLLIQMWSWVRRTRKSFHNPTNINFTTKDFALSTVLAFLLSPLWELISQSIRKKTLSSEAEKNRSFQCCCMATAIFLIEFSSFYFFKPEMILSWELNFKERKIECWK